MITIAKAKVTGHRRLSFLLRSNEQMGDSYSGYRFWFLCLPRRLSKSILPHSCFGNGECDRLCCLGYSG